MAVALGKRYKDENSEIEVLCIKPQRRRARHGGTAAEGAALRRLAAAGPASTAKAGSSAPGFGALPDRALP